MKIRLEEHKSDLVKANSKSEIAVHAISCKHDIDWNNPKVEYFEKNYRQRRFLESFQIEKFKSNGENSMNKQQKGKCIIPNQYISLSSTVK